MTSDNVTLPGTGSSIRTKERSLVHTQIVGIDLNPGGGSENLMVAGQRTMANSLPVVLPPDQSAFPVTAYNQSGTIYIDGTAYTVKRAAFAFGAAGDRDIISGVSAKTLRILALAMTTDGAVSFYFKDAAAAVLIGGSTNAMILPNGGGLVLPFNPHGWCDTSTNNSAFQINLSGDVSVAGGVVYFEF